MRYLLAVVALLALVAGCSSTASDGARPSLAEQQESNGAVVPGYSLSVPKLGIDRATMVSLGLNADGSIQVPSVSRPRALGVYAHGPMPGRVGPAVILGHVNGGGQAGVFSRLDTLRVGDDITSTAPDGTVTRFVVYRTQTIPKRDWPTAAIYADTATPELRLVTCGGRLDVAAHNVDSTVLVGARRACRGAAATIRTWISETKPEVLPLHHGGWR